MHNNTEYTNNTCCILLYTIIHIAHIEWASARVPPTPLLGGWAEGGWSISNPVTSQFFERETYAGPPRKSLDAHKKPLMWPWDACWLRMPGERHAGPPRKSLDTHKKPLMWPWDACWLRMPGERHAGPPRRSDGSGLRVAIACAGRP